MEVCQFCGMYMKPFFAPKNATEATCEFCGETIARIVDRKWEKVPAPESTTLLKENPLI